MTTSQEVRQINPSCQRRVGPFVPGKYPPLSFVIMQLYLRYVCALQQYWVLTAVISVSIQQAFDVTCQNIRRCYTFKSQNISGPLMVESTYVVERPNVCCLNWKAPFSSLKAPLYLIPMPEPIKQQHVCREMFLVKGEPFAFSSKCQERVFCQNSRRRPLKGGLTCVERGFPKRFLLPTQSYSAQNTRERCATES